jgi:hypothetical protein
VVKHPASRSAEQTILFFMDSRLFRLTGLKVTE